MSGLKQPVSVLVLIHTPQLDILLLERAGPSGLWQSVTGSREGEESLKDTALREVREETGLDPDPASLEDWQLANRFPIHPRWRPRYGPGVSHNTEHVFSLSLPEVRAIRLAPDEHTASVWQPWQEAAGRVFSWTNRDAIRLLARRAGVFPLGPQP